MTPETVVGWHRASYEAIAGIREELVQEIALTIWQALPHFRGECSERTFVFRIAHNRGLTHVAKRWPPPQSLDDLEETDEPVDPRPHPDVQLAKMNQRERLASAVQSLPVAHKHGTLAPKSAGSNLGNPNRHLRSNWVARVLRGACGGQLDDPQARGHGPSRRLPCTHGGHCAHVASDLVRGDAVPPPQNCETK